jgi:arylsulfatase A-like enzyme
MDYQWTPSIDNNAVSGVVIDQNETKIENRGPDVVDPPAAARRAREEKLRAEPYEGEPTKNPDVPGHVDSVYEDPYLDFYDPPHMIKPDTLPPVIPTRPPDWVDETFPDPPVTA